MDHFRKHEVKNFIRQLQLRSVHQCYKLTYHKQYAFVPFALAS